MQFDLRESDIVVAAISGRQSTTNEDFRFLLDGYGLPYRQEGPFLIVGEIQAGPWVLDLSVIVSDLPRLLQQIVPILAREKVAFRLPVNSATAAELYSVRFGYNEMGKVISVFPQTSKDAAKLADLLIPMTADVRGADIPSATRLGGKVFAHTSGSVLIPFTLPRSAIWPFNSVKRPSSKEKPTKLLHGRYLLTDRIKRDVKGDVVRAIDAKDWWKFRFHQVLGKEGKRDMSLDGAGRTIKHRLFWQFDVQKQLHGVVPVPQPIDCYLDAETGDSYLWMEFIDGVQIQEWRRELIGDVCWWAASTDSQLLVLQKLKDIVSMVGKMHEIGYLHRDLSPVNFLIDSSGQVRLIDLELSYNREKFAGAPPFTYGTEGFMSPEQRNGEVPTAAEDIYGLGGLIICLLVGLYPTKVEGLNPKEYSEKIYFFLRDKRMADLITACRSNEATDRPSLSQLRSCLLEYTSKVRKKLPVSTDSSLIPNETLRSLIQSHINAYATGILAREDGLWHSGAGDGPRYVWNPSGEQLIQPGFYDGVAGVLYMLSRLQKAGFDLMAIHSEIAANWGWLEQNGLQQHVNIKPGLYNGSYGVGVALAGGMAAGLVIRNETTTGYLLRLLEKPAEGLGVANGVAGKGLALLFATRELAMTGLGHLLEGCKLTVLQSQTKDGSWKFPKEGALDQLREYTGFSYGVAGVIRFLLDYYGYQKDQNVAEAIARGVGWLLSQCQQTSDKVWWTYHPKSSQFDDGLHLGYGGIVSALADAASILSDSKISALIK
jgi:serine/threonine protein kinase